MHEPGKETTHRAILCLFVEVKRGTILKACSFDGVQVTSAESDSVLDGRVLYRSCRLDDPTYPWHGMSVAPEALTTAGTPWHVSSSSVVVASPFHR